MMQKTILLLTLLSISAYSCNRVKSQAKETLNKGGEMVGESATEFFEEVSEGVEKTLETQVTLSQDLVTKGVQMGNSTIEDGPEGGENNQLTVYLIFDQDLEQQITFKAYDKNDIEIGRVKKDIMGKAGDAGFYDIVFDERTYIEVKSRIEIE